MVQGSVHQESALFQRLFATVVDVITECAREDLKNEILYGDDLVLMSESLENLREQFLKWKEAFKSKKLKVNFKKI